MPRLLRTATLLTALCSSIAAAQPAARAHKNLLSIQPISAMLTVYAAEYEHTVGNTVTLGGGVTGSQIFDELSYFSTDFKVRYYPSATPFDGFSFGGSVGYTRITEDNDGPGSSHESAGGPSMGVMLDYGWLLGAERKFYVGLGGGAKALFIDADALDEDDFAVRYPTFRVSVGLAF